MGFELARARQLGVNTNERFGGMQSVAAMAEQPNLVVHAFEATIAESPSDQGHNSVLPDATEVPPVMLWETPCGFGLHNLE